MRGVLSLALLFSAPLVLGAVCAGIWLAWYRLRQRAGRIQADDVPPFPILFLRAMVVLMVLLALGAGISSVVGRPPQHAPTTPR